MFWKKKWGNGGFWAEKVKENHGVYGGGGRRVREEKGCFWRGKGVCLALWWSTLLGFVGGACFSGGGENKGGGRDRPTEKGRRLIG